MKGSRSAEKRDSRRNLGKEARKETVRPLGKRELGKIPRETGKGCTGEKGMKEKR